MGPMKILVVVASRHGSSVEIGKAIVEEFQLADLEATALAPADVTGLDGVDAVVVGSAVYMSQWTEDARNFISHYGPQLRELPLWAFSVGLSGVPMGNVKDPRRIGPALLAINPIDHQTFNGAMDFTKLTLRERSVARLGNAPEGDYREWDKIRAWAQQIAKDLKEHAAE